MAVDLVDYELKTQNAIKCFWNSRNDAKQKQKKTGKMDQGERSGVTAGKNMDGFIDLIIDIVYANGLRDAEIHRKRSVLALPGFFRPTKLWDLLIIYKGELIAAIELKSQVGPSFGNNFNNRAEEAVGTALDLWTAYREEAFGSQPTPFVGWLMLVEDAKGSRAQVHANSPHFPVFKEFKKMSYLQRYDLLCEKMIKEKLYTVASVLSSPRSACESGGYSELSRLTGIKTFISSLAGHVAVAKSRLDES